MNIFIQNLDIEEKKLPKENIPHNQTSLCCISSREKTMITNGNKELIDCVSEYYSNLLKGNTPFNKEQKSKLCKHNNKLCKLAKKDVSLKEKKRIIQTGGFRAAISPR